MLLDDLVILGRACPEPMKDGQVTVCLAGWSEKQGFIRLYPTRYDMPCKQWDIIRVEVERNERDSRHESWKIVGSKQEWETLSEKIEILGKLEDRIARRNLIGNLRDTSVTYINDQKRSLGIIKPNVLKTYFVENTKYLETWQAGLPGFTEFDEVQVKRDFPYEPRTTYTCPEGENPDKKHDQQILEWGFYEWFRKNPEQKEQVWQNAGFSDPKRDIYYLVGNQAAHRTSFMVISVLRFPSGDIIQSMFPPRKVADDFPKSK